MIPFVTVALLGTMGLVVAVAVIVAMVMADGMLSVAEAVMLSVAEAVMLSVAVTVLLTIAEDEAVFMTMTEAVFKAGTEAASATEDLAKAAALREEAFSVTMTMAMVGMN